MRIKIKFIESDEDEGFDGLQKKVNKFLKKIGKVNTKEIKYYPEDDSNYAHFLIVYESMEDDEECLDSGNRIQFNN